MITSDQCLRQQPSPKRQSFVDRASAYNRRDAQGRDAAPLMIGLVAGGAVLIGGAIYVLATAHSARENEKNGRLPTFTPVVGTSAGGGALTWRF